MSQQFSTEHLQGGVCLNSSVPNTCRVVYKNRPLISVRNAQHCGPRNWNARVGSGIGSVQLNLELVLYEKQREFPVPPWAGVKRVTPARVPSLRYTVQPLPPILMNTCTVVFYYSEHLHGGVVIMRVHPRDSRLDRLSRKLRDQFNSPYN